MESILDPICLCHLSASTLGALVVVVIANWCVIVAIVVIVSCDRCQQGHYRLYPPVCLCVAGSIGTTASFHLYIIMF